MVTKVGVMTDVIFGRFHSDTMGWKILVVLFLLAVDSLQQAVTAAIRRGCTVALVVPPPLTVAMAIGRRFHITISLNVYYYEMK